MNKKGRSIAIAVAVFMLLAVVSVPVVMLFKEGNFQARAATVQPTNSLVTKIAPTKPQVTGELEGENTTEKEITTRKIQNSQPNNNGYDYNNNYNNNNNYTPNNNAGQQSTTKAPAEKNPGVVTEVNREQERAQNSASSSAGKEISQETLDQFGLQAVPGSGEETGGSLLSYKMDPVDGYFYTETQAWQRQFGFNRVYDQAATLIFFYYDTVRVFFTYDGLDWMIQMWKGQYGFMFLGAEIGVYTKPEGRGTGGSMEHYDCATEEQMLPMEMRMYNKGEVGFRRPYKKYWWATGFIPGTLDSFGDRSQLVMEARVTFRDATMAQLFVNGLEDVEGTNGSTFSQGKKLNIGKGSESGFCLESDEYYRKGKDVFIVWQYVKQPL